MPDGKRSIVLGSTEEGSTMQMYSRDGKMSSNLYGATKDRDPGLLFFDSKGKHRLFLGMDKDQPVIQFSDADGKIVKELKVDTASTNK